MGYRVVVGDEMLKKKKAGRGVQEAGRWGKQGECVTALGKFICLGHQLTGQGTEHGGRRSLFNHLLNPDHQTYFISLSLCHSSSWAFNPL